MILIETAKKKVAAGKFPRMAESLVLCSARNRRLFPSKEEIVKGMEFAIIKEEGNTTTDKANTYLVKTFMT
jgi:hypothetical protein